MLGGPRGGPVGLRGRGLQGEGRHGLHHPDEDRLGHHGQPQVFRLRTGSPPPEPPDLRGRGWVRLRPRVPHGHDCCGVGGRALRVLGTGASRLLLGHDAVRSPRSPRRRLRHNKQAVTARARRRTQTTQATGRVGAGGGAAAAGLVSAGRRGRGPPTRSP